MSNTNPDEQLQVCIFPFDPEEGRVSNNLNRAEAMLNRVDASKCHLAVLPEMFNAAFSANEELTRSVAESDDGPTIQRVEQWVRNYGFAIAGGFTGKDGEGHLFNRGFIILPDGTKSFYNKRHLFVVGPEGKILTPGTEMPPTVNYFGWKLKLSICYDIRFPVWNRRTPDNDYDVLIVPANWAASRAYPWKQMLIARAIENQVFVVGANRTGCDRYGNYDPTEIHIYDHWGKPINTVAPETGFAYASLSRDTLNECRARFPAWRDTDNFNIII